MDYLPNDGPAHQLYDKHRERHSERLTKICEFFRHGRLHRRPCNGRHGRHRDRDRYREEERERERERQPERENNKDIDKLPTGL